VVALGGSIYAKQLLAAAPVPRFTHLPPKLAKSLFISFEQLHASRYFSALDSAAHY